MTLRPKSCTFGRVSIYGRAKKRIWLQYLQKNWTFYHGRLIFGHFLLTSNKFWMKISDTLLEIWLVSVQLRLESTFSKSPRTVSVGHETSCKSADCVHVGKNRVTRCGHFKEIIEFPKPGVSRLTAVWDKLPWKWGSIHATPEKFQIAGLFILLAAHGPHRKVAFRKRSSQPVFKPGEFENGGDDDTTSIWFHWSSYRTIKFKQSSNCCVFEFLGLV